MSLRNGRKTLSLKMFKTVLTKTKSSIFLFFLLNLYQVSKKINAGKKQQQQQPNLEELKRENKQTNISRRAEGRDEQILHFLTGRDRTGTAQGKQVGTPMESQPPEHPELQPCSQELLSRGWQGTSACFCSCFTHHDMNSKGPVMGDGSVSPHPAHVHNLRARALPPHTNTPQQLHLYLHFSQQGSTVCAEAQDKRGFYSK